MKKFLSKIILFFILTISFFVVNMSINRYIYSKQEFPLNMSNIIIIGDSHTQKSLDPKYFKSALNLSQTSEPYILSYWKLKQITNFFIPDTLIVGFAPHNISQFNDLKFSNPKWSKEMFKRAYPIQEFENISENVSIDFLTFYKVLWKQTGFYIKKDHINYIGNYSNQELNDIPTFDCTSTIKRHFDERKKMNISLSSIAYLDSISEFCKLKEIELVLVSSPVHKNYLEEVPISIMNKYIDLKNGFQESHIIFDQTNTKYADSLFLDCDHLNKIGTEKFTTDLIKYLK